jgi:hypothetical protein
MTDVQWWASGVMLERNFGGTVAHRGDWPWPDPTPLAPLATGSFSASSSSAGPAATTSAVAAPVAGLGGNFDHVA